MAKFDLFKALGKHRGSLRLLQTKDELTFDGVRYAQKARWNDEDDADAFVNEVLEAGKKIQSALDFEGTHLTLWFTVS